MRFTGWFKDLWKQHRQDQQSLAPGQATEAPDNLLWQWHGESLGHEGDCDAFQEHNQEFSVSQNGDMLSAHTNLGTQPCISSAWAFRSPTAQLRVLFLPGSLPSSCYCFHSSLQNASCHSQASPPLDPISLSKKAPNAYPIMCVFATQLASLFQHWPQFPKALMLVLIILNCFLGFLTKI